MMTNQNCIMWSQQINELDINSQELHDIENTLPVNMLLPDLDKELEYLNEEETTDIALKMELTEALQFAPISPLGPPARGNFSGPLDFEVLVNSDDTNKKKYMYSHVMNRIYVDLDRNFPVQFKWDYAVARQQMLVRATAVFSDESQAENRVERCLQHVHPSNNLKVLGDMSLHVLQSAREPGAEGVHYCGRQQDPASWYSVAVLLPAQADAGALTLSHVYKFMCKNTCATGINRRAIEVIYTLENFGGEVFGRQSVGVRVCSCIGRDMKKDEDAAPELSGRKRKVKQELPAPGKRIKTEVAPSNAEDTQIINMAFPIVGRKTCDMLLDIALKYMKTNKAESGDEAVRKIYDKPIADIENIINCFKNQ